MLSDDFNPDGRFSRVDPAPPPHVRFRSRQPGLGIRRDTNVRALATVNVTVSRLQRAEFLVILNGVHLNKVSGRFMTNKITDPSHWESPAHAT